MPGSRSVRDRIAGQSAMSEVVLAQSGAPFRSLPARIFGVSPLVARSRASYNGALGELVVGDVLENLGTSWDVLHDLPLSEQREEGVLWLDHLVIGPAGVHAVHVANYTGKDVIVAGDKLLVAGEASDDILQAKMRADAAGELLSAASGALVRVQPLLVVVNPRRMNVRVAASAVRVIPSHQLHRVLTKAPRTLSGDEVARISDIADLASTWPDAAPPAIDVQGLHRQFAVVRNQVRTALLRRVLWGTLGIAALYLAVWSLVASFVSVLISS